MTLVRCAAGLAAVLTAMLVQATFVAPLTYPVPVSLPLLVVVAVAVVSGPSTGIALGFGAGLLADLTTRHPVGVLAVVWLGAGLVAGIVGGVVSDTDPVAAPGRRRQPVRSNRAGTGTSRWRAQGMLTGAVAAAATGVALVFLDVLDHGARDLPSALVQLVPTVLIDAILAVPVLASARAMLASAALRPVTPVRLGVDGPAGTLPMDLSETVR